MSTQIISRKEAKSLGLKRYFTGKPCKRGHVEERSVSIAACVGCTRENHFSYYANHREEALAVISNWQTNNKDTVNAATRKWRDSNPDQAKRTHDLYYNTNKERKLKYNKWWRSINKDKVQFYNAERRAQIKLAMPAWADVAKILAVYNQSTAMTAATGISHHVDHIVPLVNDLVCGLHVHENLQVLIGTNNMNKSNTFVID